MTLLAIQVRANQLSASFRGNGSLQNYLSLNGLSSFTLECWIRSDSFAQQATVFYCGQDSTSGFGLALTNTLVPGRESYATLLLGGVSQIATGNALRVPFQQWIHVAITRSPEEWKLYRNGTLVGRASSAGIGSNTNITIGNGFYGEITRFRIWNRTLDRSDIVGSMCNSNIKDSTLIAEYTPMKTGPIDTLPDIFAISPSLLSRGTVIGINDSNFPNYRPPPNLTLVSFPSHMQFFARDKDDSARVSVAGGMSPLAKDSLLLEVFKDDSEVDSIQVRATGQFNFMVPIHCELSQYSIRLVVVRSGQKLFVAEGADLLCGDVFLVDGQSNAHPAIDGYNWQNAFSRTIGVQTGNENLDPYDPADTLWGLSFATGQGAQFSGPYFVGSWARWMQEGVADAWHVPTCVINGAGGASTIDQHIRNDVNPLDSTTIYGRLLYRTLKSGLEHKIKSIFWYQGEWDSGSVYLPAFRTIFRDWTADYSREDSAPIIHFIFQTRPNLCGPGDGLAREPQREIQDSFLECTSISTVGIDGYFGCHYYWNGYVAIGQEAIRKVGKYLYNSSDSIDVDPPDISDAHYTDNSHTKIAIHFKEPIAGLVATPDTLVDGVNRTIEEAFYLDGKNNMIDSVEIQGDTIFLQLNGPSFAHSLSYTPAQTYDNDTTVYSGPWIVNSMGVGALTFGEFPVSEPVVQDVGSFLKGNLSMRVIRSNGSEGYTLYVHLVESGQTKIELMDVLGRVAETLADEWMGAGDHFIPLQSSIHGEYHFVTLYAGNNRLIAKLPPAFGD